MAEIVEDMTGIRIGFDPVAQDVSLKFKPEEFKNWDFLLAVLDMAREKAKLMKQQQMMAQMQEMQRASQLARQLSSKRPKF